MWKWMKFTILDVGVRLYGGSELLKHLSKHLLLRMRKTDTIKPDLNFFMTDENFGGDSEVILCK